MTTKLLQRGRRRGMTLPEVLIAGTIMLAIVGALTALVRFNHLIWQSGMTTMHVQSASQLAVGWMAQDIRSAIRVESAGSDSITLVLPDEDANGDMIIPVQDGDEVSYYLSDTSGVEGVSGDVLWRSVNGTPDSTWSLKDGNGRIILSQGGLSFEYTPSSAAPEIVKITVTAQNTTGTNTGTLTTSQEAILRNKFD